MSLSLNQLLSHAKARPIILLPVVLVVVATTGYLIFSKPTKETLVKNLTAQLREEKFEQLYEDADDSLRLNVTKERFVKRMRMAVTKLKAIDRDLNFQTDTVMEMALQGDDLLIRSVQKLEKDRKSVSVLIHWDTEGNFHEMSISPYQGTSEEYGVLGVSAQSYSVGDHVLEW